jgi:hypothetical protein
MKHLLLSVLLAISLLIILKLPVLADTQPIHPANEVIQENPSVDLPNDVLAITFTPVATLYLPIVVVPPPAPVISDISYHLLSGDDPDCVGGVVFSVSFKYTDRNGDAEFGYVKTVAVALPSGETFEDLAFPDTYGSSDGYQGEAFFYVCIEFTDPDTQLKVTVVLVDGANLESNPLTVIIPRS